MKRVALFVGIDEYKDTSINSLSCAANDATSLRNKFKKLWNGLDDRVELLVDAKATPEAVTDKIEFLTRDLAEGDLFVFYFSGHGCEFDDKHYLLGPDVRLQTLNRKHELGTLPLLAVRDMTNKHGLQRLFILDCCRNDLRSGVKGVMRCPRTRSVAMRPIIERDKNSPKIIPPVILHSCDIGECAYEDKENCHGYFTHALLKVLNTHQYITFQDFRGRLGEQMQTTLPEDQHICWDGDTECELYLFPVGSSTTTSDNNVGFTPTSEEQEILNSLIERDLFDNYRMMLAESALMHRKNGNLALAERFERIQRKLREQLELFSNRAPVLALVGLNRVDRFRMLCALFEVNVALRGNNLGLIKFCYGKRYELVVHSVRSVNEVLATSDFDSAEELFNFVQDIDFDSQKVLCLKMPHYLLRDGLTIVDIPGFLLEEFSTSLASDVWSIDSLSRINALFWVVSPRNGIGRKELDFYKRFLAGRCKNIIVEDCESMNKSVKREFKVKNGVSLGGEMNWIFVDSRNGQGRRGENGRMQSADVSDFEDHVCRLGTYGKKLNYVYKSLVYQFDELNGLKRQSGKQQFFVEHRRIAVNNTLARFYENGVLLSGIKESLNR